MTALVQKPGNGTLGFTKNATLGLYGREKELELMQNTLDKLMAGALPEHERQLILISGFSGTGKTALANHGLTQSTEKLGGLYVRGKFDMNLRNQPYSGINAACTELCNAILELRFRHASSFQLLCNQIKTELGSELELLLHVIPIMAEVVVYAEDDDDNNKDDHNEKSGEADMGEMSSAESKNQLNFAFLRFIRTISYQFVPLVFVLDDLQWADGASLDLIDVLLTDPNTSRLMVVGIYRTNEVDKTHVFYRTIEDLEQKTKDNCFEMTQIEIGNLELDAVHSIVLELLSLDNDSQTSSLAEVCHKKTLGNPFFVLQYLAMLTERRTLRFNFSTVSWTWDENGIEVSTSASENVVDLLKARMGELLTSFIDVLKLASCLGSTFEMKTLKLIRDKTSMQSSRQHNDLMASLEAFEAGGYILKSASTTTHLSYSWGHDIIQEAAHSLIPEAERGAFAAKIGRIILKHREDKGLDSKIFIVVNLLNQADDKLLGNDKRLEVARLNYRASRKAVWLSAFESAAEYATRGIALLPKNAWVDHYEFTLLIYTIGAQAEGFIGNVDTMQQYCQQVLLQEERPIEDKLGVYNTWIDSAVNRGSLDEARGLLIAVLKKFHCHFPKNSALVGLELVSNVVHIKASAKTIDASKLSLLNDRTKLEVMKLVDKLNFVLYRLHDDRMPLTVFRSVNWTIKYGVCDLSSVAFATAGLILTGLLSDLQGGTKFGQQALALMEMSKSQSTKGRTLFLVHSFVFPWTKPARSLLKPLQRSYDVGLQTGDTESASFSVLFRLCLKFQIGTSLESLDEDSLLHFKQTHVLKRDRAACTIKCMRQTFVNLMDRDNVGNPIHFAGGSLTEDNLESFRKDAFFAAGVINSHGALLTYFGEHVRHADMVIKAGHDYLQKTHIASPVIMWDTLFKGISCFAAARETGKRIYKKLAKIFRSKIQAWVAMGNPNVKHYEVFLDAEWTALKGKKFTAIKHYEATILSAVRGGYQHDAALATERLGEFHLLVLGDRPEAINQFTHSIKYWRDWGAMAKVRHLEEKYADLMPNST